MATIGDIKAGLNNGKAEATKAIAQLNGVNQQIDRAISILQALIAGTNQPAVMQALAKLAGAKQKLAESQGMINSAIADTDRYNAAI